MIHLCATILAVSQINTVKNHPDNDLQDWLAVALRRFTNFETVQITNVDVTVERSFMHHTRPGLRERHKDTFTSLATVPLITRLFLWRNLALSKYVPEHRAIRGSKRRGLADALHSLRIGQK